MSAIFLSALPEGRLFGLDIQTVYSVLIQLFNAGVLAALLSFILYKPLSNFMRKRAQGIAGQLDQAARDMEEAEALKTRYEEKLSQIETEKAGILEAARQLAAQRAKAMLEEAKTEADTTRERAKIEIGKERERAQEAMRLHIIEVSAFMAEKLLASAIDPQLHHRLFDETMAEMEDAAWPG